MITFHSRQSDCAQRAQENQNAGAFNFTSQIASSICTVIQTKRFKIDATIFKSRCSRTVLCYRLDRVYALPFSWAKVSRLANSSPELVQSPASWVRNVRDATGRTSGEMSRVIVAQCSPNERAASDTLSPDNRRDGLQANLRYTGVGRSAFAPETRETTRQSGRATAA